MDDAVNRRGMLRGLVGEATRAAGEIARSFDEPVQPMTQEAPGPEPIEDRRSVPIQPSSSLHYASLEELEALAAEAGLGRHLEAVLRLACPSARLLPAERDSAHFPSRSRAGGVPDLPAGVERPTEDSIQFPLLTQLNLSHLSTCLGPELAPRLSGMLWCFLENRPAVHDRLALGAARCVTAAKIGFSSDAFPQDTATHSVGRPLQFSPELTLPRAWSAVVQGLDLPIPDLEAWQGLRRRLAEIQGLTPIDSLPGGAVVHRYLGYPDERIGVMPLVCAKHAEGIGLDDGLTISESLHLEEESRRWRMLLQLSNDPELEWSWGEARERLYLWVHEDDLLSRDLSRVFAIAQ